MIKIPRWFYKLKYAVVDGELVKIINPVYIENA